MMPAVINPPTAATPAPTSTHTPAPVAGVTAAPGTREYNAQVIAKVANEFGIDPVLAVATSIVESGLNARENTGDGGSSFGLFQLHMGGQLPKAWYPGQPDHAKAFDPELNAREALSRFRNNKDRYSGAELAFRSQRPANHDAYVKKVDSRFAEARALLGM